MACASQAMISANSYTLFFNKYQKEAKKKQSLNLFRIRASSEDPDCNVEECAPEKEVGTVSMEWLAGEKTKVVGTFPPRNRGWTGYVEKDTAGQTNIYSVEPSIYVAESVISSGNSGSSSDGSQNTAAIATGLALISIAAASSILLQVGKNPPQMQTVEYSGPSLSYYITKFKPPEMIQASVPTKTETETETETSTPAHPESFAPEVSQV
uniref:Proline-rich family protein n=1 Tax=Davidia involucrata TaxID=16924 RepID=A0A5B7BPB8_DAVIN